MVSETLQGFVSDITKRDTYYASAEAVNYEQCLSDLTNEGQISLVRYIEAARSPGSSLYRAKAVS